MIKMSRLMLVLVVAAGCSGKKDSPKDKDEAASAKPSEAAPPVPSGPWGAWDMDARAKAWQGAWTGDFEAIGAKAAWSVDGAKATVVDGSGQKTLEFAINSPCSATFTEKSADGSSSGTVTTYTIQNGALVTGLGDAGTRKGDTAVVCGMGNVYTLDAKGCQEWHDDFGKLSAEPGECGIRKDGGKDVFWYKANGMETVLNIDGDVIWSDQMRDKHAQKQPDLASAKKAAGF
jgi:hypothetical protein